MSDDSNHKAPNYEGSATPASNQNLIIGLILGAAILALLFMVISTQNGSSGSGRDSSEVTALKNQVANMTRELENDPRNTNLGLASNNYGVDPQKLAEEISTEANALAGLIGGFGDTIRQKDALLQSAKDTEQLLNRRIQELQRQLNDMSETARKALTLQQELDSARTLLESANRQIEELRKRPDADTLERLRRENEELRSQVLALSELPEENRKLQAEVQRLQALLDRSTLYVEDANALPAIAQRLYRELERLEGLDPVALQNKYTLIEAELGARPLRSVSFATGSAALTSANIGTIRNDISETSPDSFLLVVGYASTVGDFDSNRQLSAKRSTSVASQVNTAKKSGQKVRGVFLNETNRFSREKAELNQICEIWEIKP